MLELALEEAERRTGRQCQRIRHEPLLEESMAVPRPLAVPVAKRRHPSCRPQQPRERDDPPSRPGRRGNPGRRREQEPANEVGPPVSKPQGNEAAEGVAGDERGLARLMLDQRSDDVGEIVHLRAARQRTGAGVARQIRHEEPEAT